MNTDTLQKTQSITKFLCNNELTIVCDFDHTIVNTSFFHKTCLAEIMKEFQIQNKDLSHLRGKTEFEIWSEIQKIFSQKITFLDFVNRRSRILEKLVNENKKIVEVIPGIEILIREMRIKKYQSGIATNSPERFVNSMLSKIMVDKKPISDVFPSNKVVGICTLINKARYPEEVNKLLKPNPLSVFMAAGLEKETTHPIIYIGDGVSDIELLNHPLSQNIVGIIINDNLSGRINVIKKMT